MNTFIVYKGFLSSSSESGAYLVLGKKTLKSLK